MIWFEFLAQILDFDLGRSRVEFCGGSWAGEKCLSGLKQRVKLCSFCSLQALRVLISYLKEKNLRILEYTALGGCHVLI